MSRRATGIAAASLASTGGVAASVWAAVVGGAALGDLLAGTAVVTIFTGTGALLVAARPRNRIGWLLMAIGATWAIGGGALDVAHHGIVEAPGSVPGVSVWALAGGAFRSVSWFLSVLGLATYFPTGTVRSGRWRWLPRALGVVLVCIVINGLGAADANVSLPGWRNPLTLPPEFGFLEGLTFLASLPLAVVVGGFAVAQLVVRWRRGGAIERR
jgi:hypothetical protein